VKMALAQLYSRTGDSKKAELLMASLTGGPAAALNSDMFGPALREDADPGEVAHGAEKSLNALSDQFDSGEFDHLDANAFSAMDTVALSWARMGWAQFLQGENVPAWQYLEAAWYLSQSGTVANRLARVFEKTGAKDRAEHMYALAVAAGGPEAQSSRQQILKLDPANAEKQLSQAMAELQKMRVLSLPQLASQNGSARFALLFDNSNTPDRVQFLDGDESLRSAGDKLQKLEFPVKFPDVSSIKVIRLGTASCVTSGCTFQLQPLNSMQQSIHPELAATPKGP
jgi:hypothetical protein